MIGTLAWTVTFSTARKGLAGLWPRPVPRRCAKCNSSPINGQGTNLMLFNMALTINAFALSWVNVSDVLVVEYDFAAIKTTNRFTHRIHPTKDRRWKESHRCRWTPWTTSNSEIRSSVTTTTTTETLSASADDSDVAVDAELPAGGLFPPCPSPDRSPTTEQHTPLSEAGLSSIDLYEVI